MSYVITGSTRFTNYRTPRAKLLDALNAALAATPDYERGELQQAAMDYRTAHGHAKGLAELLMDALVYAD